MGSGIDGINKKYLNASVGSEIDSINKKYLVKNEKAASRQCKSKVFISVVLFDLFLVTQLTGGLQGPLATLTLIDTRTSTFY